MNGFYFENHNNLAIDSGTGPTLIGHLDLDPGSYMVWGKLRVGVNVGTGTPGPTWPYATGLAALILGQADDAASYGVKPESAENNATLNLMCAATIDRTRPARLYLINLYPLRIYCHTIRLMALQLEALTETEVGDDREEMPIRERLRDTIIQGRANHRELIKKLVDDD
jgi:hypothetical protein